MSEPQTKDSLDRKHKRVDIQRICCVIAKPFLCLLCIALVGLFVYMRGRVTIYVTEKYWKTIIRIEKYQEVEESGNELPDGAKLLYVSEDEDGTCYHYTIGSWTRSREVVVTQEAGEPYFGDANLQKNERVEITAIRYCIMAIRENQDNAEIPVARPIWDQIEAGNYYEIVFDGIQVNKAKRKAGY